MNGINGGIGLWIAKERMQDLRRDAALARRARPIDGEQVVGRAGRTGADHPPVPAPGRRPLSDDERRAR